MEWIIALGILLLILVSTFLVLLAPLGLSIRYDQDGARVLARLGLIRFRLYPYADGSFMDTLVKMLTQKKKGKKTEPEKDEQKKEEKEEKPGLLEGGSFSDFYPFITTVIDFLGDFRRKLRLNYVQFKLILAGGDPADLAINYGRAWAAVGNLWPLLENIFVIKKRDVEVECDFEGDSTVFLARIDLTMTVFRISALLLRYLVRATKEYIDFRNKRNGGNLL